MTIGIGAIGPNAGLGVFEGLRAAEAVGEGSIGGHAVLRVITDDRALMTLKTQRGGTMTLVTEGERTGGPPPKVVCQAQIAAVISSGPDRPEPLESMLPGEPSVGLVTGHRLPRTPTKAGVPLNVAVLQMMGRGHTAQEAIRLALQEDPGIDAGIIAVDTRGNLGAQNSPFVLKRSDAAECIRSDARAGCRVAVFLNSIHPREVAIVAAAKCLQIMTRSRVPDFHVVLQPGIHATLGGEDRVTINDDYEATGVTVTDPTILSGEHRCAVPRLDAGVYRHGERVGHIMSDTAVILNEGVISRAARGGYISLPARSCSRGPEHQATCEGHSAVCSDCIAPRLC